MAEKRARRRFMAELKAQVVKRVLENGKGLTEVATKLGLSTGQLSTWRTEHVAAGSAEPLTARKADEAEVYLVVKPPWPDAAGSRGPEIAVRSHLVQDRAVRRHTTASCFATHLLPHVLFVADFEKRQRIAKVCCLAWNTGLFPDDAERERQAEQVLDLILADAADAAPPVFRTASPMSCACWSRPSAICSRGGSRT